MNAAVTDTVAFLDDLAADGVPPAEALARLAPLRGRHPGAAIDLVWEEEPYDRTFHYDAIIRPDDRRTVSVSVANRPALPWPLRGAVRASERDLLRVNDVTLKVDQALICLDAMWDQPELLLRLVDACVIQEELAADPIELTPAEVQRAVDAFRRGKGLVSAAATRAWMAERSLAEGAFVQLAADQAVLARLRARVVGDRAGAWFEAHREEMANVTVAWAALGGEISGGPGGPETMAELIVDSHRAGRPGGIERRPAADVPPELLDGKVGKMAAPVWAPAQRWVAVQVLAMHHAVFDSGTRRTVEERLWHDWLAERRQQARVNWLWGSPSRTAAV